MVSILTGMLMDGIVAVDRLLGSAGLRQLPAPM
jgi:hypothetical protein